MQEVINKFKEGLKPLIKDTTSLEVFHLLIDEMTEAALMKGRIREVFQLLHAYNQSLLNLKKINKETFLEVEKLLYEYYMKCKECLKINLI